MPENPSQRILIEGIEKKLTPWARAGTLRVANTQWPFQVPGGVAVRGLDTPLLSRGTSEHFTLGDRRWPEQRVRSSAYAVIACVLEGEADMRIGVTDEMVEAGGAEKEVGGVHVFSLPAQGLMVIPPGVPFTDGGGPHWERPHPERASSHILWFQILPRSILLHTCTTAGRSHTHSSLVMINNLQIASLAHFFVENFKGPALLKEEIGRSSLLTLLLCIQRALAGRGAWPVNDAPKVVWDGNEAAFDAALLESDSEYALQLACEYIRIHLTDRLTLAQIAQNSYISVSRLKRLFRARMDVSVMQYVVQCRMEEAKTFLRDTEMTVEDVRESCGYTFRTHFTRAFKQYTGLSPREYRRQQRAAATVRPAQ